FREAHHVTGRIVGLASDREIGLEELALEDMQGIEPRITAEVFGVLGVEASVRSRTSHGGTAPDNVRAQAERWLEQLRGTAPARS
ncbi:MAG TPA: argininosuccinate lyase, partial [Enterovirga sp.]|nr:argininosuccinate lyase [Enterovirga sp.]